MRVFENICIHFRGDDDAGILRQIDKDTGEVVIFTSQEVIGDIFNSPDLVNCPVTSYDIIDSTGATVTSGILYDRFLIKTRTAEELKVSSDIDNPSLFLWKSFTLGIKATTKFGLTAT